MAAWSTTRSKSPLMTSQILVAGHGPTAKGFQSIGCLGDLSARPGHAQAVATVGGWKTAPAAESGEQPVPLGPFSAYGEMTMPRLEASAEFFRTPRKRAWSLSGAGRTEPSGGIVERLCGTSPCRRYQPLW